MFGVKVDAGGTGSSRRSPRRSGAGAAVPAGAEVPDPVGAGAARGAAGVKVVLPKAAAMLGFTFTSDSFLPRGASAWFRRIRLWNQCKQLPKQEVMEWEMR